MISSKLLLVLMAVASSFGAPQINEGQVVRSVISQLQPAITQALSGIGRRSFSSAPSFSSRSSSAFPSTRRSFSSSPSTSVSSLTSSVVSALQQPIAQAVAKALAGSRRTSPSFRPVMGTTLEENYGPAQYDFSYKVADDESQAYMTQQESRNGDDVTGSYNYIDATGALVTVNYEAGPQGYTETRDVEKGAVAMREIPGAWTGPLAGVDDGVIPARGGVSRGLSQADLIAQIISVIQPNIQSAVSSAVSSRSSVGTRASGLGQSNFVSTRRGGSRFSSGQDNIINSVISSIQPRISSAVNSAIQSTRRVSVARPRIVAPTRTQSQGVAGLFGGLDGNSVRIETPEFNIQY